MPDASTPWSAFAAAEPATAGIVVSRFAANLHHVLGTVAPDGRPRLSGLEAPIRDGHLWLGMMPGSVKCADLRRDPRFAIHAAPLDVEMLVGDAKVDGIAVEVSPADDEWDLFLSGMSATDDTPDAPEGHVPDGGMALFLTDLQRVTLTRVAGDVLQVTTWTPRDGLVVREVR